MTLPTGTVTFLFTDIEGSTRLWEAHPESMRVALARHDFLLRSGIESNGGTVFKTIGDAFCAAFSTAPEALEAALVAQKGLHQINAGEGSDLTLKVRMALHTGTAEQRDSDYFGQPLNRAARLLATGHGGQVILSHAIVELVRDHLPENTSVTDLGEHRLKDLQRQEQMYQLLHPDLQTDFPPLKSLDNPDLHNNLPAQLTSFIGREVEMAEVKALLGKTRLLTLTGSGGSGKTRLCLQVAADVMELYPDGVWFVELAAIVDPGMVPQTVAQPLTIREVPGELITRTLLSSVKNKLMLLILDNCEHLLEASTLLVDDLLKSCPQVMVLASSREVLGISGESSYRVPSLSSPQPAKKYDPESISQYEAVRLFIERARAAKSDLTVTSENTPALASICQRLDGIPLAIELAAARIRSLPVEEINDRLDQRFRLLTGGSRTALARHQTLRAMIDWSYDLLNDKQQALLCRLSVFSGGWRVPAAEQVCAGDGIDDWEVLDLLLSLVDKSLVVPEHRAGSARYRLLETVRQCARDRLVENGESDAVRNRHLGYFFDVAEDASPKTPQQQPGEWLQRLEEDHENLSAGLDWSLLQGVSSEGLSLCGALCKFWHHRGYYSEGRDWCIQFLENVGAQERTPERAKTLIWAAQFACDQGDYTSAKSYARESLTISREIGNERGVAWSLFYLGLVAWSIGDYASARTYYEESLTISRETGDVRSTSAALNGLGTVTVHQGEYASARTYLEESLSIHREIGNQGGIAQALNNLGWNAATQRDIASARKYFQESLDIRTEIGYRWGIAAELHGLGYVAYLERDYAYARTYYEQSLGIKREIEDRLGSAETLESLAALAFEERRVNQASTLWGAAESLRENIGVPLPPNEREEYDLNVAAARAELGDEAFSAAWTAGRAMTMEEAVELALEKVGSSL